MDDALDFPEVMFALDEWARTTPHGVRTGGGQGNFTDIQLTTRPDPREPEVQVTFRAQLVDGRPVINVFRSPTPAVQWSDTDHMAEATCFVISDEEIRSFGRDPAATCEGCAVLGTIGRAVRTDAKGAVTEMHRFCIGCWPEQSARYRARWEDEDRRWSDDLHRGRRSAVGAGPGMWFQAATWHANLDLVRKIEQLMVAPIPPTARDLAQIAARIREGASELEGEMPFEIEAFLQRYTAPGDGDGE